MTRLSSAASAFGRIIALMPKPSEGLGEWQLLETAEAVAEHAAKWLWALACSRQGEIAICLSGGSTPQRLYLQLASAPFASRMPWNRIHWFWGDERFVRHDDPASNYRMAYDALFSRVSVSQDRIHPIPTEGLSPERAAVTYQSLLQSYYGANRLDVGRPVFDITFLGVGEDGHTASLFPDSATLQEDRQWVCAVVGEAIQTRITLTFPTLNSSRNIAFLVTGKNKKKVLAQIRAGDGSPPAARIRPTGHLYWFVDHAAMPG
jgi:6-phosphogluconolactonase